MFRNHPKPGMRLKLSAKAMRHLMAIYVIHYFDESKI